ncbi:MAG: phosphoribosylglycinamide formyltransferase [Candidatus Margulisiibacteriota bacterium]
MPKLGILISGRGSNMSAIINNIHAGELNAEVAVVISHNPMANGLVVAASQGIPTEVFELSMFESRDAYEFEIIKCLNNYDVDLVVLAGYMKLVGDPLLNAYSERMINIHPSLLPSFKGLNAQKQALEYGVKIAGCSVHYVTKEMDAGPIIMQAAVPVFDDDTEESLTQRILVEEHKLYPKAIQAILNQ